MAPATNDNGNVASTDEAEFRALLKRLTAPLPRIELPDSAEVIRRLQTRRDHGFFQYARLILCRHSSSYRKSQELVLRGQIRDIHKSWYAWLGERDTYRIPDAELSQENRHAKRRFFDVGERLDAPGVTETRLRVAGNRKWEAALAAVEDVTINLALSGLHFLDLCLKKEGEDKPLVDCLPLVKMVNMVGKENTRGMFTDPIFENETVTIAIFMRLCMDCEDYLQRSSGVKDLSGRQYDALAAAFSNYIIRQASGSRATNIIMTLHMGWSDKVSEFSGDVTQAGDIKFTRPDAAEFGKLLASAPRDKIDTMSDAILNALDAEDYTGCPALKAHSDRQKCNFVVYSIQLMVDAIKTSLFDNNPYRLPDVCQRKSQINKGFGYWQK